VDLLWQTAMCCLCCHLSRNTLYVLAPQWRFARQTSQKRAPTFNIDNFSGVGVHDLQPQCRCTALMLSPPSFMSIPFRHHARTPDGGWAAPGQATVPVQPS
jgi:hypothetical protein